MADLRMPQINEVRIAGRVSRDGELRYSNGGMAVLSLNVAVPRITKKDGEKKEETYWAQCTAFGKTAEYAVDYCRKGAPVYITGSLSQDEYEDKNGNKVSKTRILVDRIQPLAWAEKADDAPRSKSAPQPVAQDDEAIPF